MAPGSHDPLGANTTKLQIHHPIKTNLYLLCLLLGGVSLYACREKEIIPTADFDYQFADPGLAGYLSVYPTYISLKANNKSSNGQSYYWDFGNGTTSTQAEPEFFYDHSGEYTIRLSVTTVPPEEKRRVTPALPKACQLNP